jgi:large subunit ribosomal protein L13
MLPGGPLKRQQMSNLRIYKGTDHPHIAQNPEKLDIASRNPKNTLRG